MSKENIAQLPISMSVSKEQMIIDRQNEKGDKIDLTIYVHSNNASGITTLRSNNNDSLNQQEFVNITMHATSSISKYGYLWNMTGKFDKDQFIIDNAYLSNSKEPIKNSFEIKPTKNVIPGNYTLTISTRHNNDLTYSKVIDMLVK